MRTYVGGRGGSPRTRRYPASGPPRGRSRTGRRRGRPPRGRRWRSARRRRGRRKRTTPRWRRRSGTGRRCWRRRRGSRSSASSSPRRCWCCCCSSSPAAGGRAPRSIAWRGGSRVRETGLRDLVLLLLVVLWKAAVLMTRSGRGRKEGEAEKGWFNSSSPSAC